MLALDDVQGEARVNEQQLAAVEAQGEVFVSAGAGTGKTAVLVERFARAVCDDGLDVDSVLGGDPLSVPVLHALVALAGVSGGRSQRR